MAPWTCYNSNSTVKTRQNKKPRHLRQHKVAIENYLHTEQFYKIYAQNIRNFSFIF